MTLDPRREPGFDSGAKAEDSGVRHNPTIFFCGRCGASLDYSNGAPERCPRCQNPVTQPRRPGRETPDEMRRRYLAQVGKLGRDNAEQAAELERLRVERNRLEGLLVQTEAKLQEYRRDGLTGLYRKEIFTELVEHEMLSVRRANFGKDPNTTQITHPATLLIADIDLFKKVNDTHGHLLGDEVLAGTATCFMERLRVYDLGGRFGGEEFYFFLRQCSQENAVALANSVRRTVEIDREYPGADGKLFTVTVTVGVVMYKSINDSYKDMFVRADEALYFGKHNGRNCTVVWGENGQHVLFR